MIDITIREARKTLGLTQTKLAERIGVTQATISMWENGETEPGFKFLKLLSQVLHVTIDDLVNGELAS